MSESGNDRRSQMCLYVERHGSVFAADDGFFINEYRLRVCMIFFFALKMRSGIRNDRLCFSAPFSSSFHTIF